MILGNTHLSSEYFETDCVKSRTENSQYSDRRDNNNIKNVCGDRVMLSRSCSGTCYSRVNEIGIPYISFRIVSEILEKSDRKVFGRTRARTKQCNIILHVLLFFE